MSQEPLQSAERDAVAGRVPSIQQALQFDPSLPANSLRTFYRWGWAPLIVGCAGIALVIIVTSELLLDYFGIAPADARLRAVFITRAVLTSFLLALWAGWYVLRSRQRIEAVREQLRNQQIVLAEQSWRIEQVMGLGALSRVLAHEIRGPLHSIALQMAVVRKQLRSGQVESARLGGVVGQVEEDVERLDGLLQDYMEYTHTPTGSLLAQPLALRELVDGVLAAHQAGFERKGVRVEVDFPEDLPPVSADPTRLRQLVLLLVRNAQEAVTTDGAVRFAARADGSDVLVSIANDGPHVDQPEAVFRPFFSARRGSSGLALAIVRDIVRAHGGEVSASGLPTGGLEITVRLPTEHS